MKKIILGSIITLALVGTLLLVYVNIIKKDTYMDAEMGELIEFHLTSSRYEVVEDIFSLNLGYTPYYTTLLDVKKCKGLETLRMGDDWHYFGDNSEVPQAESNERIKQIQSELGEILDECEKIDCIRIVNYEGILSLDDLSFLENRDNICNLMIKNMGNIDYSYIFSCDNLEQLGLSGCEISSLEGIENLHYLKLLWIDDTSVSSAEDIIKLASVENMEEINISNTPLAQNEEEVEKLRTAFPDAVITID
ncbi:MAG: hypothetical protein IJO70_07605 [Lachnospiraceae bacterium]|nr:hypothetical protein [Lachnospiraceae bacterium]